MYLKVLSGTSSSFGSCVFDCKCAAFWKSGSPWDPYSILVIVKRGSLSMLL